MSKDKLENDEEEPSKQDDEISSINPDDLPVDLNEPEEDILVNPKQKSGHLSLYEKKYIEDNYKEKSAREIARHLRKNHVTITRYVKEVYGRSANQDEQDAQFDIKRSPVWSDIKKQFSDNELKMFLYNWGRVIAQFKSHQILPTEEIQIVDMIKLDILMNRALIEQNKSVSEIRFLESELESERSKDEKDRDRIFNLEKQIGILRASLESLSGLYQELLQKKNSLFKDLKATRESRIKVVENYKQSFSLWISKILSDNELRKNLGEKMEKMRLASEKTYEELSQYHTYADNTVDLPILNCDNVPNE